MHKTYCTYSYSKAACLSNQGICLAGWLIPQNKMLATVMHDYYVQAYLFEFSLSSFHDFLPVVHF